MNKTQKRFIDLVIRKFEKMTEEQRAEMFLAINRTFCQYCGREHRKKPYERCQCWNDG